MRPELQQIDRIVRYHNNDMTIQEKAEFEMYLSEHPEIKGEIENILLLEKAVVRNAIKTDIVKYAPKNTAGFSKWIAIFSALIVLVGLIYFVKSNSSNVFSGSNSEAITSLDENPIPTADSVIQTIQTNDTIVRNNQTKSPDQSVLTNFRSGNSNVPNQVKFWLEPDVQRFEIDPIVGKAIECNNGTLIVVPAHAFVDETGQIIQMPVQLEVIEATKLSEMIAYNLTTTANGKPLSSGGMLYIQPFVDGKKVWINPQRPLYIEIPTDDFNPNMQSWRGVVDDKGDILWEEPRDLEKFLVRVDFELLDFLPPGFEDAVHAGMPFRGHSNATKELVDSLYYALIGYIFDIEKTSNDGQNLGGKTMMPPISSGVKKRKKWVGSNVLNGNQIKKYSWNEREVWCQYL